MQTGLETITCTILIAVEVHGWVVTSRPRTNQPSYSEAYEETCITWQGIGRGGLFHVSDGTYDFFKAVELAPRRILPCHLKTSASTSDAVQEGIKKRQEWSRCADMYPAPTADEAHTIWRPK